MGKVVFITQKNKLFQINSLVAAQLHKVAASSFFKRKSGGVLLGRHIKSTKDIVVDEITKPFWGDKRRRTHFQMVSPKHQRIISNKWEESEGTTNYLGLWETSFDSDLSPSEYNLAEWSRRTHEDFVDAESSFYLLVNESHLRVWEYSQNGIISEIFPV